MQGCIPHFTSNPLTNQTQGIKGVWDGFFPWGTLQAVAKGAVFSAAHIAARNALQPLVAKGTIPSQGAEVIAGGIGGGRCIFLAVSLVE
jgi:hypothetical protein